MMPGSSVLAVILLALGAATPRVAGQDATKKPTVGFVSPLDRSTPHFEAFRQGLAELGYVDGRDITIEARFAEGQYDRLPGMLAEFVRLKVDVIAVGGAVTARAAKKAVTGIPVVFAVVVDPIADGLVPDMERPGGTFTGTTSFDPEQARKQLDLLKSAIPGMKRVALLGDGGVSEALISASEAQAKAMGLTVQRVRVTAPNPDLDGAFASLRGAHADAIVVLEEPVVGVFAGRIAELANRARLPTLFAPSRVKAGGLISYGTRQVDAIRRSGAYVDKILKGANPGDLSVERVIPYELIVNLRTAKEIGVSIPPEVLARADRVIDAPGAAEAHPPASLK